MYSHKDASSNSLVGAQATDAVTQSVIEMADTAVRIQDVTRETMAKNKEDMRNKDNEFNVRNQSLSNTQEKLDPAAVKVQQGQKAKTDKTTADAAAANEAPELSIEAATKATDSNATPSGDAPSPAAAAPAGKSCLLLYQGCPTNVANPGNL